MISDWQEDDKSAMSPIFFTLSAFWPNEKKMDDGQTNFFG
jgi:hypothetical protein